MNKAVVAVTGLILINLKKDIRATSIVQLVMPDFLKKELVQNVVNMPDCQKMMMRLFVTSALKNSLVFAVIKPISR